jgi:hypothetical protein
MAIAAPSLGLAEGSGDFVSGVKLAPAETYGGPNKRSSFIEVESWNSTGEGVGNCGGDYLEATEHQACTGDIASGYDEAYCTACNGDTGWAFVHNHSAFYTSYFTGWEHYR